MRNISETNTRKHAHKCKNPNLKHNKNTKQPPISVVWFILSKQNMKLQNHSIKINPQNTKIILNPIHTEFDSKKEIKSKENYYFVTNTGHASF